MLSLVASLVIAATAFEFSPVDLSKTPETIIKLQCDDSEEVKTCYVIASHFYREEPSGFCTKNCCRVEQDFHVIVLEHRAEGVWMDPKVDAVLVKDGKTEWLFQTPLGTWSTLGRPIKLTCEWIEPA